MKEIKMDILGQLETSQKQIEESFNGLRLQKEKFASLLN